MVAGIRFWGQKSLQNVEYNRIDGVSVETYWFFVLFSCIPFTFLSVTLISFNPLWTFLLFSFYFSSLVLLPSLSHTLLPTVPSSLFLLYPIPFRNLYWRYIMWKVWGIHIEDYLLSFILAYAIFMFSLWQHTRKIYGQSTNWRINKTFTSPRFLFLYF